MFTGNIILNDLDTSISEFLAWESMSRDTINAKRVYCDIAGDLVSGVLLSQIICWHLPDKNGDSRLSVDRSDHLWLEKSDPDWWKECRVTEKQARRAIRVLVDRGIIEVGKWQFNGAPTNHIRLNWPVFLKALEEATVVAKEKVVSQFRSVQKGGSLTENTSKITSEINSEVDFENEVDDESHQHDSSSSVPTKQKPRRKSSSKPPKELIKAIATWTDMSQRSKKVTAAASVMHTERLGNERTIEDWVQRYWPCDRPSNAM